MNKSIKGQQGGFTLIELIVVIVILGILAATALPRFANLGGEARLASLNAARGALSATSAMTHGKWLVNRIAPIQIEGITVAMNATSGYPATTTDIEATNFARAAGLEPADYTVFTARSATPRPPVTGNQIAIVPNSVIGTPSATTCYLLYTPAAAANTAPTYRIGAVNATTAQNVTACQ